VSQPVADIGPGILLIDKPDGITSAGVVNRVKRALKALKVGHAGTLDPFATGLLICCIDHATRLARFFLETDKIYRATLHLGVETDTGDSTGRVEAKNFSPPLSEFSGGMISEERICSAFQQFVGKISQVPPAFSALKHQGIPLYRWARRGKTIQKPPRIVTIHRLTVLDIDFPRVRFEVSCSSGTYIRSLGTDVGRALGCGGHLSQLRRIQSGRFHVDEAIPLGVLEETAAIGRLRERIIPMASALKGWPELAVGDTVAEKVRYGRPISADDIPTGCVGVPENDLTTCIKVIDEKGALLALLHRNGKGGYGYCGVFGNQA